MHIVFSVLLLLLFIYEAVALAIAPKHPGDTISEIIWAATAKRPFIPFLFGLLMGHFFWRW